MKYCLVDRSYSLQELQREPLSTVRNRQLYIVYSFLIDAVYVKFSQIQSNQVSFNNVTSAVQISQKRFTVLQRAIHFYTRSEASYYI